MLNYSDFLFKKVILGHSPLMIQFTTIFSPKHLKLILLQLHMERKLHKCLVNFKAATVTEKAVYTSHLGQKKRGGIWLKIARHFLAKHFFFWLCSAGFLGCTKMLFKGKNDVLSFLDVLQCLMKIHFCIPFVYLKFTSFFLSCS